MQKQKRKGLSYEVKNILGNLGLILAIVAIPGFIGVHAYIYQAEYKFVEGDVVDLLRNDNEGTIVDSLYADSDSVPEYMIRITDKYGKFTESKFYESEIKGLVKKIN